jgi:zinc transporter 1
MSSIKIKRQPRLWIMLGFLALFFLAEVIAGLIAHSLALLADAFHMLSDMIAIGIGIYAIRIAKKHPSETKTINTYGWQRAEVLGAFANAIFLLALCLAIFLQAIERFISPQTIENPILVLVVGGAGLFINIFGMWLFHDYQLGGHTHGSSKKDKKQVVKHLSLRKSLTSLPIIELPPQLNIKDATVSHHKISQKCVPTCTENCKLPGHKEMEPIIEEEEVIEVEHQHYNMKGIFIHILGDALGSIGVILTALIIYFGKFQARFYFDPIVSIFIAIIIGFTSFPLVKSTGFILLQAVPEAIDLEKMLNDMIKLPGVLDVHELHVWQLSDTKLIASVHIAFDENQNYMDLATNIKKTFHLYGIHSSTIQPEFIYSGDKVNNTVCLLQCHNESCNQKTCCVKLEESSIYESQSAVTESSSSEKKDLYIP